MYFFYPETAYRSLEEMDSIFHKTTSVFSVVRIAKDEPRWYGKNGELLIDYEQTQEHKRRVSHVSNDHEKGAGVVANREHANPDYHMEMGKSE